MIKKNIYLSVFFLILLVGNFCFADDFRFMTDSFPPFNFKSDSNGIRGITADSLVIIMNRSGFDVSHKDIEIMPWVRAHKITEKGPKAVLFSVARTATRENLFKWVGPIHSINIGFIAAKSADIKIRQDSDLKQYRIGTVRGSAPEQIAKKKTNLTQEDLFSLAKPEQIIEMFKLGRLDLIIHTNIFLSHLLESHGLSPDDFEMIYQLMTLDLYIAFSPDTEDSLIARLQSELDKMKKKKPNGLSEFDLLIRQYLKGEKINITQRNVQ